VSGSAGAGHGPSLERRGLVRPPLMRATGEERHPTWLESFFDLCLVTAISPLAAWETLLGHRRPEALGPVSSAHTSGPVG